MDDHRSASRGAKRRSGVRIGGRRVRPVAGPIVVVGDGDAARDARDVALRLGASLMSRAAWEAAEPPPVVVWCDGEGLGLRGPPRDAAVRRPPEPSRGRPGRDPLVRALGRPAARTSVIDATAGWGVDAGVLAAAGARVTMLERSPAMALLLEVALARWRAGGHPAASRLTLHAGDATALLAALPSHDVVYLDPLYPGRETRDTSAAALRWLRTVASWSHAGVSGAGDERTLLEAARASASRRVVVKRGRGDPFLGGVAPSGSLVGRTTRYDLYAGAAATPT